MTVWIPIFLLSASPAAPSPLSYKLLVILVTLLLAQKLFVDFK